MGGRETIPESQRESLECQDGDLSSACIAEGCEGDSVEAVLGAFQFHKKDRAQSGQLLQLRIDLGFFPDVPALSAGGLL